jgi:Winged helix-turn-helix DNA-binding
MSQATRPQQAPDERITGPMRVLIESGITTRELAQKMHVSQSTAARRIREFHAARKLAFRMKVLVTAMYGLLTVSVLVIAAALATLAWG